jgi:predicted SprT family Zn-dependent metalloprotease
MKPSTIHAIVADEQARARAIVAGLGHCTIRLSRATTELGAFTVDRRTRAIEIRISRHLRDEAQVRETARHELAHQAAWERYRDLSHGGLWQTMASYLGCEPVPCSQDGFDPDVMRRRQRYEISCLRCGARTLRQRRSKLVAMPWRFQCAQCGGKLEVARTSLDNG